jgi:dephospho-CoA kinase
MILVGLTGGIASGKTEVSKTFKKLGAYLIDADEIAHALLEPATPTWKKVVETFGTEILQPDQKINRKRLGQIVFDDPQKLLALNTILHPPVFAEEERRRKAIERVDPQAVVVFDVPLLVETQAHKRMDKVIVVTIDINTQLKRLMQRDGLSKREAQKRIRAQMPLKEKAKYADYLIDSSESPAKMETHIHQIFEELKRLAATANP